jgi:hypothetical protein
MSNLLYFVLIFILIVVILSLKDKFIPKMSKKLPYLITLLSTALIIVCIIYLLQTFVVESFHFEVSPKRELGMLENVLPVPPTLNQSYFAPSTKYPIQGSGITCSKIYTGHEGDLNMNIGEWKRGSGNGIPARPDSFLPNSTSMTPFSGNCRTCEVDDGNLKIIENYNDKNEINNEVEKLKQLKIVMYSNDKCGYCVKSKKLFGKNLKYITVKNNVPLPEGIKGYPYFISLQTKKSHTGYPSSIQNLIKNLSVHENYEPKPYNSNYFNYNSYIAPSEKKVLKTLSCYSGTCPLKNKSGKLGVPFV